MIHSMTGFGKGVSGSAAGKVTVEIRAFNHKFLELSARVPNGFTNLEEKIRQRVNDKICRGKISLNVIFDSNGHLADGVEIDKGMARMYYRELEALRKSLGIKNPVNIEQIIALPNVLKAEPVHEKAKKIWPAVSAALDKALASLVSMRQREGLQIYKDMERRVRIIKRMTGAISKRYPFVINRYKKHLYKRIKEISQEPAVNRERLEVEIAIFARNTDIAEEIVRLKSHLDAFDKALGSTKEAGRKLDFIAQELNREINTIEAKANDFKISSYAIEVKSQIDKLREQVQNIE
ncbi:MAG: YicC family protein [Candidatus Omnitrophica bacterium CG1_02_49_10]|nr:MAG: YicC family protein [Candidatus Omnitrophica bacterium CG1_02_49_10]